MSAVKQEAFKNPLLYSDQEIDQLPADTCKSLLKYFRREYGCVVDRLNLNSTNSSLSPSSNSLTSLHSTNDPVSPTRKCKEKKEAAPPTQKTRKKRDKGYGRTQKHAITAEQSHLPSCCEKCSHVFLDSHEAVSYTSFNQLDLAKSGLGDYHLINTLHVLKQRTCDCGHVSRFKFNKIQTSEEKIQLSSWRLVGPQLAATIVFWMKQIGTTSSKVRCILDNLYNIKLSIGTINRVVIESGLAAQPIHHELKKEIQSADLVYADETGWPEAGKKKWLWVFVTKTIGYFEIGRRTVDFVSSVLPDDFSGVLMSDGYAAYRHFEVRMRCWAHLLRKAKGLSESSDNEGQYVGKTILNILNNLMDSIYQAREENKRSVRLESFESLSMLRTICEMVKLQFTHKKSVSFVTEFLRDWDAIFYILDHPDMPLTNNEAERALRHWVILRRLTQGTRTPLGSTVQGVLASMIETAKRRGKNFLTLMTDVIKKARLGLDVSKLLIAESAI